MDKRNDVIEVFWNKLEEQTEKILIRHSSEVHALAKALLERNDMNGKEAIEVMHSAANGVEPLDSELVLKDLVDQTIVSGNGKNGKSLAKSKTKPKKKLKAKA